MDVNCAAAVVVAVAAIGATFVLLLLPLRGSQKGVFASASISTRHWDKNDGIKL